MENNLDVEHLDSAFLFFSLLRIQRLQHPDSPLSLILSLQSNVDHANSHWGEKKNTNPDIQRPFWFGGKFAFGVKN